MLKKLKTQNNTSPELSFYKHLNTENLNYEEFKRNVFKRLTLLRQVENGVYKLESIQTQEEDDISHFCLKLICAQSRWSMKWFINLETQLFKHRIAQNIETAKYFFSEKIWPHLNIKGCLNNKTTYDTSHINEKQLTEDLKFHFSCCSDVLSKRNHKVEQGFFGLTDDVVNSFTVELFKKTLSKTMDELYDKIKIDSDERLIKLNTEIFTIPDASSTIPTEDVFQKAKFFPLCIQGIIQKLKTQNHLKYTDRQILCLFLKDIGTSLNESINFFKSNFKCSTDQFAKEYLYSIRHNYGLEGKRANYQCFPCVRIMGCSNETGCFGCPFVNNHDFVKLNSDIEDINRESIKCCASVGAKISNSAAVKLHYSPAEYFKIYAAEKVE